jgi:hypothetical protein
MVKPRVENETKEKKFKRIAASRTNRILNDLRLLGNCSNRSIYSYSKEEVDKIFSALHRELRRVRTRFSEVSMDFTLD